MPCPARGLCAAFCVKEAMRKALGRPFDFTECEFFLAKNQGKSSLVVSRRFASDNRNVVPLATIMTPARDHLTAVVYLLSAT
jgi:phosphopantetheinyl transferase (holo-ACP synthase)